MTLPASGQISLSQVNTELGKSATATIGLNDADVRALFGVPSGQIKMSDGYGKTFVFKFTISSNQTNANLRTLAINAGWTENTPVEATIGSGIVISGNTPGNSTAALTVDGSWPGGVTLVNNGSIIGRGGTGGNGGSAINFVITSPTAGSAGGRALFVSTALTLNNAGTIAGGGGGGGGGAALISGQGDVHSGGGGGGGGRSGNVGAPGGNGGTGSGGASGTNGGPGGSGTISAAGAGGQPSGGSGGGYGAAGGGSGGAAGQAISGNSNITYIATGTRLGPIV